MNEFFIYLIKSSGLLAVFFLAYHFLVRKETFFNSNRWFLLSGLFTSLLLPLYFFKKIILVESPKILMEDLVVYSQPATKTIQEFPVVEALDWLQYFWISYIIITSVLLLKIVLNFISLYRLLYRNQVISKEQFKLINLNENIAPFSFFNYIVYNSDLYTDEELQSILLHEKIHSQERHSIDVLIAKLFSIIFWFNPFVWLYKKAITQNLEYIADQKASQQLEDKKSYQHALLKVVSHQSCLSITNNFYQSLIKKRIVMLNKNQSHKRNTWKYALVIPALIGFVLLFQIRVIAQEKSTSNNSKIIETHEGADITFDSKETDKSLGTIKNVFKEEKIITDISKIKRNSNGEIIGIYIKMKSEDGRKKELRINQNTPIDEILIYTIRLESGLYDFGIKHLNKKEAGIIRNEIHKKREGIGNNNSNENTIAYNYTDSIKVVGNFDLDLKVPELPEAPVFPEHFWNDSDTQTKIVIEKEGKEALVIFNGKVVSGDESIIPKKELDQLVEKSSPSNKSFRHSASDKNKNHTIINGTDVMKIRTDAMENARVQIKGMQQQVDKKIRIANGDWKQVQTELDKSKAELDRSKPEMEAEKAALIEAKNEMVKAKAELEAAKEALQKAKAELKPRK